MGGLTANVEYFYKKCNDVLKNVIPKYTADDWGGAENIKKAINVEWLAAATEKVYQRIHGPKTGCRLLLSSRFNPTAFKISVPVEVVNSVVNYLKNLDKPCDNDCACYKDLNCNCACTANCSSQCTTCVGIRKSNGMGTGVCSNQSNCNCACACTCSNCACQCNCNCACECGSDTECVCDCTPYDCNCSQVLNCNYGSSRPATQNCVYNCGNCECACECYTPPVTTGGGGGACQGTCNCSDGFQPFTTGDYYDNNGNPNHPSACACVGSSSGGGCLPLWETILTPRGLTTISDINVGDEVYSWNLFNNKIELDKVFYKYVSDEEVQIYKIEFENGDPLYCDGVHAHTTTTSLLSHIDPDLYIEYVPNYLKWTKCFSKRLKIGDKLITRDGYKKVKSISEYSKEKVAELFLEKNHGYITKECLSFTASKNMLKAIPNILLQFGLNIKKEKSCFKYDIIPFTVYAIRLIIKNVKYKLFH